MAKIIAPFTSFEAIEAEEELTRLYAKADDLDRKTIRPLRAIQSGGDADEDYQILSVLESEIKEVRVRIEELKTIIGEQP
jgi:hypothetical protein